ncbi:Signal transduction histidine kinase [Burkholderiales bacterium]|nr:Signal transduction histidine kinase [Burkholderiales bacterium]
MKRPSLKLRSPPLFWRTFLLIVSLAVASLVAWVPSVRVFEREPRAHQLAEQVISIIHATRIALVYSDPDRRRDLLADMLADESLRVVSLEPTDQVEPIRDSPLLRLVEQEVQQRLGSNTRLASKVNGTSGFWVSFSIDEDAYWVFIERDLLRRDIGHGWIAWALLATAFSVLAAIAIARLVNRPLAALSHAASDLGAGRIPSALPDAGPIEIRTVNRSFNRMVSDLEKLNRDRAILLAGVSHDLRTPLTRMRLEVEMSDLPQASRDAMIGDLEQMDSIVSQFLDYALPTPRRAAEAVDLSALVKEALARSRLQPAGDAAAGPEGDAAIARPVRLREDVPPGITVPGHRTELARTLDNILGNAQRYGRGPDGSLELEVLLRRDGSEAVLELADHGPGIAPQEIVRLVRPFERGDPSRSGALGAGLGLAIVERVVRLHGGRLAFHANTPTGLRIELRFPVQPAPQAAPGGGPGSTAR